MMRRAIIYLTILLLGCSTAGCRREEPEPETVPIVVVEPEDIAVARVTELSAGPQISGSLEPEVEASILSEISGTVTTAPALEGERVSVGTLLAEIAEPALAERRRSIETAIAAAELAAENARRDLERMRTLAAAGAVARREIETAQNVLAAAETELATAEAQLADLIKDEEATTITAPIDGIVSARLVSRGDVVMVGTELYRIVDPRSMMLEADLPAEWMIGIRVGSPARFKVRGYPNRIFVGSVRRINPAAEPMTRHIVLHISIPNPGGTLIAGLFAEGWITTTARETLAVPTDAVRRERRGNAEDPAREDPALGEGREYTMRIRSGTVEKVWVKTGIRDERRELVEIVSGIQKGDTVLVGPAMQIEPGAAIRVERLARPPNRVQ